ncbi:MAG: YigZ family protein [Bacteroidales bacterium]|nr:YigZ family protein [Bacteroidales bacterium]
MKTDNTDTYKTISKKSEGLYRDKGSRFISFLYPVQSEEEIKNILSAIKKEYYNATHHCYAYTIGHVDIPEYRMNDDGEPSGTAGKPIYGQLLSYDLKDVLAIVVRFFGGVKLGTSGLINAYKTATQIAIENASIVERKIKNSYQISFDYLYMNEVMQILKKDYVSIKKNDYIEDAYCLEFDVILSKSEEVIASLELIEKSKITFLKTS